MSYDEPTASLYDIYQVLNNLDTELERQTKMLERIAIALEKLSENKQEE